VAFERAVIRWAVLPADGVSVAALIGAGMFLAGLRRRALAPGDAGSNYEASCSKRTPVMDHSLIMERFFLSCATAGVLALAAGCATHGAMSQVMPVNPSSTDRSASVLKGAAATGETAFPNGTAWPLPGTIDFDNYDTGGEGVAYHTKNTANPGGKYRTDGVGIEGDTDTGNGNGFDVGWNNSGNYYKYSVNVQTGGSYPAAYRIAANAAGSMHIEDELGKNLTGEMQIAATGGFQAWTTVRGTISLTSGMHILKVVIDSGNSSFNLNDMTIGQGALPNPEAAYPNGTPWPVPGTIDLDNYDTGGEGVAYHTHNTTNPGGKYRNDGVGIEADRDAGNGNGFDVGWNANGNWYRYSVNVQSGGTYPVAFRLAANSLGTLHIEDETGANLTSTVQVPASGGFQAWATFTSSVPLSAGKHILKVVIDSGNGSFNLNDMTIGSPTATPGPSQSPLPSPSPSPKPSTSPTPAPTTGPSDIDWPTQGFDGARSGENPKETQLTTATAAKLHLLWKARIGGDTTSKYANSQPVVAARVPVGGVPTDIVYTGDEHGYFGAFNAMTGAMLWRKALGSEVTGCPDIPDSRYGVTDAATIDHAHNRIYVVDGAGMLWAFDLATGNVSPGWPANGISVVDNPMIDHVWSGVSFNPSNGNVYVPTASYCDIGRWHGSLRSVNTQTASVTAVYYFATGTTAPPGPTGAFGGGVWSWGGIAIDPVTQNLYSATGNTNPQVASPASNESMTEWSPTLGLIASTFPTIGNGDLDFGGSAVLYNGGGSQCAAAYRKSGQLFAFDRTNLNAGPTTSWQIGQSGISSPAFSSATGLLYVNNPTAGALPQGLYAFQTGTGCVLNQTPVWSVTGVNASLQPISVAGGVVYDQFGSQLKAFSAASGALLWTSGSSITNGMFTGPAIVNGHVYVVDWSDTLYAFGM
jgi:hypothetical protein